MTLFYFIVGLGLLVFIHELGHFLVAKWNGIRVERFSLGFGPKIVGFRWGETEYCLSALPLGGYVKMTGQEDLPRLEDPDLPHDPKAYTSKSVWARLSVVLAGPVMNLLLPLLLLPLTYLIGGLELKVYRERPEIKQLVPDSLAQKAGLQVGDKILSVGGQPVGSWRELLDKLPESPQAATLQLGIDRQGENLEKSLNIPQTDPCDGRTLGFEPGQFLDFAPVLGDVASGYPAANAGLKPGDRILSIDGNKIESWSQMNAQVLASGGRTLKFQVWRGGQKLDFEVTPKLHNDCYRQDKSVVAHYRIFTIMRPQDNLQYYEFHRYGFAESMEKGFSSYLRLYQATGKILQQLFSAKVSAEDFGGPLRIAEVSAQAGERGLSDFLSLMAFLSIQLGIMNLLPIPVLDGGHAAFLIYEIIFRRPPSPRWKLLFMQVGFVLLLGFMAFVVFHDVWMMWGAKFAGWFKTLF